MFVLKVHKGTHFLCMPQWEMGIFVVLSMETQQTPMWVLLFDEKFLHGSVRIANNIHTPR